MQKVHPKAPFNPLYSLGIFGICTHESKKTLIIHVFEYPPLIEPTSPPTAGLYAQPNRSRWSMAIDGFCEIEPILHHLLDVQVQNSNKCENS